MLNVSTLQHRQRLFLEVVSSDDGLPLSAPPVGPHLPHHRPSIGRSPASERVGLDLSAAAVMRFQVVEDLPATLPTLCEHRVFPYRCYAQYPKKVQYFMLWSVIRRSAF